MEKREVYKPYSFAADYGVIALLRAIAEHRGISMSELIREALAEYLRGWCTR